MSESLPAVAADVRNLKDDVRDLELDHVTREEFLEVRAITLSNQKAILWLTGAAAGGGAVIGMFMPQIMSVIGELMK
ncbi:MAG: hypothetical protein ACK5QX_10565 [bacterium]|jgi:hypothetical protein